MRNNKYPGCKWDPFGKAWLQISKNDLATAMECDLAFHRELARLSGNEIFGLMLDSIADLGRDSRRATMSEAGVDRTIGHHAAVLVCIEKRDAAGAEEAMRIHIASAVEDLLAFEGKEKS